MSEQPRSLVPAGWPRPSGYSDGVIATGRILVTSGQIGWDPLTHRVAEGGFVAQVRQALANLVAVLRAGGAEPEHLVRLTWYVTDRQGYLDTRAEVGRAYREIVGRHYPARAVVIVAGLVEAGAMIEIEATAVLPS